MNEPDFKLLEVFLNRAINPIAMSPARKQLMREELHAHILDSYQANLASGANHASAIQSAINSLGQPDQLRIQLQHSVPLLEHLFFICLNQKEILMDILLWILGVGAMLAATGFQFSQHDQVFLAGLALVSGLGFKHLWRPNNIASRIIGAGWPWFIGIVVMLFGAAFILPAAAQMKHAGAPELLAMEFLTAGTLILLAGAAFIIRAVTIHVRRPA